MNKKGFTLIEIIAVIVILAVIAALVIPFFGKGVAKSKNIGGKDVENVLVENIKLYNTDKESEIWSAQSKSGDCFVISVEELMHYNPDIKLGNCLINSYDSLIIQKVDNGYGYFANITCSEEFSAENGYTLSGQNTDNAYYRSNNEYSCNNLD